MMHFWGRPLFRGFRGSLLEGLKGVFNLNFKLKRVLTEMGCVKMVAPWQ